MKLDDLPKKNVYRVPDRYFDQLPGRVMARVSQRESAENPVAWLAIWRQPLLRGALAGLALVLSFIYFFTINTSQAPAAASGEDLLANVTEKEAVDYLMVSDQLEPQDLTSLPLPEEDLSHEFLQVSQEELRQAVENEDLDGIYIY